MPNLGTGQAAYDESLASVVPARAETARPHRQPHSDLNVERHLEGGADSLGVRSWGRRYQRAHVPLIEGG